MAFELNANRRIGLALLWLAVPAIAGVWLSATLKASGDLRKFMPALSKLKALLLPDAARAASARSATQRELAHGV